MASLFPRNKLREVAQLIPSDQIKNHLAIIQTWRDDYHTGTLKKDKETSREQAYNQDVFIKILGYRTKPASPYTFEPKATTARRQLPDAVLSYTDAAQSIENIAAVVELKSAKIDLDRPQQREGNMSPVAQGFKYKSQYRSCPFVVVSNFWEFRLYNDNQLDYERWTLDDLVDLADDYMHFKTFYVLLHSDYLTTAKGRSKTEELLTDIRIEQENIGKKFYAIYKDARLELLRDVYRRNENVRADMEFGIQKAQKVIDRIVFSCFAQNMGLLPDETVQRVVRYADNLSYGTLWSAFKGFFESVDTGSDKLGIPRGYNGGLFAPDPELDRLRFGDDALRTVAELSNYRFDEELSVNILGHIFEQSISDLEEIKAKVSKWQLANAFDPLPATTSGRRDQEGVFYTPDLIVRYIVDSSLGRYLREHEDRLKRVHGLSMRFGEAGYDARERLVYLDYQIFLQGIKVLDPACGSGAFLVHVFDYLLAENKRVDLILGGSLFSTDDYVRQILGNNVFGVDLNEESVEITKLSLWLKTAEKGKQLTALDNNIKCGNSLVEDAEFADGKSFDWSASFSDVFKVGGFDVVVMNPPYVDSEEMVKSIPEQRKYLSQKYLTTQGNWDLYIPFMEKAMKLLKTGGLAGFITPDKWLSKPFGVEARANLFEGMVSITNAGRDVFEDVNVDAIVTVVGKDPVSKLGIYKIDATFLDFIGEFPKNVIKPPYLFDHLFSPESSLITKIDAKTHTLSEWAMCESACSTADCYKLKPLIVDDEVLGDDQWLRMVNTGTVDRYTSRWGRSPMTYLKDKYLYPRISRDRFATEFGNSYYRKSIIPKLIIKGLTLLDAFADFDGTVVPGKSTLVLPSGDPTVLKFLLMLINSRLPIFYIKRKYSSASYNGGINFTKEMLNSFPTPRFTRATIDEMASWADDLLARLDFLTVQSDQFRDLVVSEYRLTAWPKRMSHWWELEFDQFVTGLGTRLTLTQKSELIPVWKSARLGCVKLSSAIQGIETKVNASLYSLYSLSVDEINVIEKASA